MKFSITVLTLGLSLSAINITEAAPRKINGIAAKANGKVVTINEVAFMLAPRRAELAARYPRRGAKYSSELKSAKQKILDELINRQLIIHEFDALGAVIPDHTIDAEVKHQINTVFNGSETQFSDQLKQSDLSRAKFRELTKKKLIGQAMRAQHFNGAAPTTPAELKSEFNKHKKDLRDITKDKIDFERIYIPTENVDDLLASPESQLLLTEDLIKQIKNGGNFAELAKTHSKGRLAVNGGQQKNMLRTDLSPAIGMILFTEPTGTVIGPLAAGQPDAPDGYHIIRVIKKIDGPAPALSKVKDRIEQIIQNRKSSVRFQRYLTRIRKRAIIKYY